MQEPTYQYVRGLGWQPFPTVLSLEAQTRDGKKLRLEERQPQVGDYCSWDWVEYLTLEQFKSTLRYQSIDTIPRFTPELLAILEDSKARHSMNYYMITLVPLD